MKKLNFKHLYFDAPTNTTKSTDLAPAKTIDHINRLVGNISTLQKILGVTQMIPMAAGNTVKRYKNTVTKAAQQVGEGEEIGLTKVTRAPLTDLTLTLKKYLKLTTAEAIQKVGKEIALEETDNAVLEDVQKDVRDAFFTSLTANGGSAGTNAATLQAVLANLWGALSVYFEDKEVQSIFFVNPLDVATYMGSAAITIQTLGALQYVENFLGLGTVILTPRITQGTVYATAVQNLNGVYVPQGGDLADTFDLTYDQSGLVGMTHSRVDGRASVNTLLLSGVLFYAEDQTGVYHASISNQ
jgi:hypothetical protein